VVRTAAHDLTGRTLGEFEIRERVSTGGMGTVYKAFQTGMQRIVALKVLPPDMAANEVTLQRFYQEAKLAAQLDHPNIVRAIAAGTDEGTPYLAMEFVEGESVKQRLKRQGKLNEPEAIRITLAVAQALSVAHARGIIHRDIKPENVLLTRDGQVKVADFGLAKRLDQDLALTQEGKGLGTTLYMAPEQFKNARDADARTDVYSLGLTLYAMLSGAAPWAGLDITEVYKRKQAGDLAPVRQLVPSVSSRTESVIERATQPVPDRRYANCGELIAELQPPAGATMARPAVLAQPLADEQGPSAAVRPDPTPQAVDWFVRYFDKDGKRRQLRLRTDELRQGVKSGRLATDMRVARSEQGPWLHLSAYNEFVDLLAQLSRGTQEAAMEKDIHKTVAALHAGAPLRRRDRPWALWLAIGAAVVVAAALAIWLLQ
jgi:serine/threonine-protein kinase